MIQNDPNDPKDTNDPNDPKDPNKPNDPKDPKDPNDPKDPSDPNDLNDPNDPNYPIVVKYPIRSKRCKGMKSLPGVLFRCDIAHDLVYGTPAGSSNTPGC